MSTDNTRTSNLPTAEDLRRWRKDRDHLVAEEKEIKRRRAKLDKLIEAAAAFIDAQKRVERAVEEDGNDQDAAPRAPKRYKGGSWTETIRTIVATAEQGITFKDLKVAIAETHLGDTLKRTEKSFYGGIGKLADRGKIIKHNGRLFTPKHYRQFMLDVEAGCATDHPPPPPGGHESPNKKALMAYLTERPQGATAGEIIKSLLNNPTTKDAVSRNKTPVYNLLGRLVSRKQLSKRGKKYYLAAAKTETPGPSGPDASNNHGGGNGTSPSSGSGGNTTSLAALPGAIPAHPGE